MAASRTTTDSATTLHARKKATKSAAELTADSQPMITRTTLQVTAHSAPQTMIDRRQLIAEEAYRLAMQRGFAAGHDVADWLAAEARVDAHLAAKK